MRRVKLGMRFMLFFCRTSDLFCIAFRCAVFVDRKSNLAAHRRRMEDPITEKTKQCYWKKSGFKIMIFCCCFHLSPCSIWKLTLVLLLSFLRLPFPYFFLFLHHIFSFPLLLRGNQCKTAIKLTMLCRRNKNFSNLFVVHYLSSVCCSYWYRCDICCIFFFLIKSS